MTKEFKDFDILAQQLTKVLEHIRSCTTAPDLEQWSSEGCKNATEVLGSIKANIDVNLAIMSEIGCVCPVCVAAKTRIEGCKAHISDLRTRMSKYTSSDFQNPLEAMLLLGTTTALVIMVRDLIEALSELAQEAHDMCCAVIESKIASMAVNNGSTTNNEPNNEPN